MWLGLLVWGASAQTPSLVDPSFDPGRGADNDVLALALQPDGSLNTGFAGGTGANNNVRSLALQADGRILIGGTFTTYEGPARNGADYSLLPGTLTFLPGEAEQGLVVALVQKPEVEGSRTFQIILTNPSPGSFLGSPPNLTVTIEDQDSEFYLGMADEAFEGGAPPQGRIFRRGLMQQTATVRLRTADGTASANHDDLPVDQVLRFAPGESAKAIVVPALHDGLAEGDETLAVSLSGPTGQSLIVGPSNAVMVIHDNDRGIEFAATNLFVNEGSSTVVLVVQRGDDGTNTVAVRFATLAGTAQPGQDFVAVSGVLSLPPGGTNTITVPLLYSCEIESEETFRVVLSDPSPEVSLGAASSALVTILDPERGGSVDLDFTAAAVPPYVPITVSALSLQADGRILIANMYGLWRLEPGGALDAGFGFTGVPVNDVVVQPDGKMLVGMVGCFPSATYGNPLARLHPDGALDAGFSPCLSCGSVVAFTLLADGRFVTAGNLRFCSGLDRRLARFQPDGSVDAGFAAPAELPVPSVLAAQTDGRILAGWVDGPPTLLRLQTNGAVDSSFRPIFGYASPNAGDAGVRSLLLQPDGKIVVSGHFRFVNGVPRRRLARLNPDGSLDLSFNPGTGLDASAAALARQPDGKMILGGRFTTVDGVACNQVARLNPDGSLDRSFDVGAGPNARVDRVLALPDGQILVAGAFDRFNGVPGRTLVRLHGGAAPRRLSSVARRPGGVTALRLENARCGRYVLEASFDLGPWQPVSTNEPVQGQLLFFDTNAAPQRFYRVRGLPP